MLDSSTFDFRHPDIKGILAERADRLIWLRKHPEKLDPIKAYYRDPRHTADFINDWGMTYDPRNLEVGLPATVPFVLFPKQREMVDWLIDRWLSRERGLCDKSREVGASWVIVSVASKLCIFDEGMAIGLGSRKEEYVDCGDDPKSLLFKARFFVSHLPEEFRAGCDPERDSPHMRLFFPTTRSAIGGEAGANIGRGARTGIYVVDEAAFLEHPDSIERALSATTNCRIDVSSANGMANPFAQWRHSGKIPVFTFHWRDDPRKDDAWYAAQCAKLDPVTVASEIDINYLASTVGALIPSAWVQASIDAAEKLKFPASGAKVGALDVADEGPDLNAFGSRHGAVLTSLDEWSGKDGDVYATTARAFDIAETMGLRGFRYDADGLGAGVRGDARILNELRPAHRRMKIDAFRGSAAVVDPESEDVEKRKNVDFFKNLKAQSWWSLRARFHKTWRAVIDKAPFDPADMISIPSTLLLRTKLVIELSQPTYSIDNAGKVVIDKKPDGAPSPNLADAVMMLYARLDADMEITQDVLAAAARFRFR